MLKKLFLGLCMALVSCGSDLDVRHAVDSNGRVIQVPTYVDKARNRPCTIMATVAGLRCVPEYPIATVLHLSPTCIGQGLVQIRDMHDDAIREINGDGLVQVHGLCTQGLPVNGAMFAYIKGVCQPVNVSLTETVWACPVPMTTFPIVIGP